MKLGHVGLPVSDIARAKVFYDAIGPQVGFELIEDSDDVIEAVSIAQSFIAAHDDPAWRQSGSHMMLFYGDYGRGKSHIAGAIAHQLIELASNDIKVA